MIWIIALIVFVIFAAWVIALNRTIDHLQRAARRTANSIDLHRAWHEQRGDVELRAADLD